MTYEPHLNHPVFLDGEAINTQNWATGTNGVKVDEIKGWLGDTPDLRDNRTPNPGYDGERPGNLRASGRTITLKGVVSGSTYADLQAKKLALAEKLAATNDEVVLKLPEPDQVSPTWSHSASMSGFERAEVRVVDGVAFGAQVGPLLQEWSCSVRASDPRIYSDTVTSSNILGVGTTVVNAGVPTPPTLTMGLTNASYNNAVQADDRSIIWLNDVSAFYESGTAATPLFVMDAAKRDAYFQVPHAKGRRTLLEPIAQWRFAEASGTTLDNAEGTAAYDMTLSGSATGYQQSGPFPGSFGMDLGTRTATVAYNAAMHPAEFTIEGWAKCGGSTGALYDCYGSSKGFRIVGATTGVLFYLGGTAGLTPVGIISDYAGAGTFTGWFHVAMTYKDGVARCYINGELVSVKRASYVPQTSGTTRMNFDGTFAGSNDMSTWTLYDYALTDADIASMASSSGLFDYRVGAGGYIAQLVWDDIPNGSTLWGITGSYTTLGLAYREARK